MKIILVGLPNRNVLRLKECHQWSFCFEMDTWKDADQLYQKCLPINCSRIKSSNVHYNASLKVVFIVSQPDAIFNILFQLFSWSWWVLEKKSTKSFLCVDHSKVDNYMTWFPKTQMRTLLPLNDVLVTENMHKWEALFSTMYFTLMFFQGLCILD